MKKFLFSVILSGYFLALTGTEPQSIYDKSVRKIEIPSAFFGGDATGTGAVCMQAVEQKGGQAFLSWYYELKGTFGEQSFQLKTNSYVPNINTGHNLCYMPDAGIVFVVLQNRLSSLQLDISTIDSFPKNVTTPFPCQHFALKCFPSFGDLILPPNKDIKLIQSGSKITIFLMSGTNYAFHVDFDCIKKQTGAIYPTLSKEQQEKLVSPEALMPKAVEMLKSRYATPPSMQDSAVVLFKSHYFFQFYNYPEMNGKEQSAKAHICISADATTGEISPDILHSESGDYLNPQKPQPPQVAIPSAADSKPIISNVQRKEQKTMQAVIVFTDTEVKELFKDPNYMLLALLERIAMKRQVWKPSDGMKSFEAKMRWGKWWSGWESNPRPIRCERRFRKTSLWTKDNAMAYHRVYGKIAIPKKKTGFLKKPKTGSLKNFLGFWLDKHP